MMQGFAEGIDAGAADVNASAARAMAGVSNTLKAGPTAITGTASLSLSGGVSASDLQAQAQAESLARLTDVLDNLSDDLRSASKEERDAMAETVTKAFVAASTASTQKVITAVKKQ